MKPFAVILAGAALTLAASGPASTIELEGDPAAGQRAYSLCLSCHAVHEEAERIGPHLVNIFGREAGVVEGFDYSQALAESGVIWETSSLDAFIANPHDFIPGNRMAFAGIRDAQRRADIIAYLREVSEEE